MRERPLFPARLYIYDQNGMHDEGLEILSEAQLNGPGVKLLIQMAMRDKVEIRLTDPDDFLLLHAKDGKILFPDDAAIASCVVDRLIGGWSDGKS